MTLDRLWAGWRGEFVSGAALGDDPQPECVFDAILASGLPDTESHVLWRDPAGLVVALLNAYPYTSGHLMVMPVRHVADIEDLAGDEAVALWAAVTESVRALKSAYGPEGIIPRVGHDLRKRRSKRRAASMPKPAPAPRRDAPGVSAPGS